MNGFGLLVKEHGGKFKHFHQGTGLKRHWRSMDSGLSAQKGICGGLSLLFLGLQKLNGGLQLYHKNTDSNKAIFLFAERTHQFGGINSDAAQLENAARHIGLSRASARILCSTANRVARNCIQSPMGLSMVGLPGHYCAASKKGNRVIFFDPNFGFGNFPDTLKFTTFLENFLAMGIYRTGTMGVTWFK